MKETLYNHFNCVIDLDCVLLPKILEIYEKHEAWKNYLQGKSQKDKNALKGKISQKDERGKGQKS